MTPCYGRHDAAMSGWEKRHEDHEPRAKQGAVRYLALHQVTDDLVVEVLHGLPLDPFLGILVLLGLEGQLDEQLLQLLVAVVDAELLEAT